MMRKTALALAFAATLSACPPPPEGEPDGGPPVRECSTKVLAESNPDCLLTLDTEAQSYIDKLDKVDWWMLDVPSLPPRSLLTVTAQYKVPSTPVVLTVNVTEADGSTSVATGTDPRLASSTTAGGPGPAQAVGKITKTGKYFVIVRHDTSADDPALDKRNPYTLLAKVESDPDLNEPNDTTAEATNVTLAACGSWATATGALSTSGDMDRFKFDVGQCGGRTILYLSIEAPASPGPQIRLNYVLNGPAGVVANDFSKSPMKDQLVATARLSASGHYELAINAYMGPKDIVPPPGDTTFVYKVKVGLFPDQDANEGLTGNDKPETATNVGLSPGGSKVFDGRLSYTGDYDTYKIDVAGNARVYYKLQYTTAAGQYPKVPTLVPKQLTVFTIDKSAACVSNCGGDPSYTVPWCNKNQCLHQERMDDAKIADYANYEGQLLMPAGKGPFYLQFGYTGAEGGDDIPYKLTVAVKSATAPTTEASPQVVNLPAEGTAVLGWSYGGLPTSGAPNALPMLPRSPLDYDKDHDVEFLEFRLAPTAADQTFQLKWKSDPPAGQAAGRAYDVAMQLAFCKDAACSGLDPMPENGSIGYSDGTTNPWYVGKTDAGLPGMQAAYQFDPGTGTFQTRSAMCTCIDAAHLAGGKFKVAVEAINRTSYEDSTIHLQFGLSSYPFTAVNDSGTSFQCPTPCGWVGSY